MGAVVDVKVEADTLSANVVEEEVKMGQGENPCDSVSQCDNEQQDNGVTIKCVNANDKETQQSQLSLETTELTQTAPLLDIKDLDTVIEDVIIPKKKNKKRRKHAKKKKPGTIDQEEEDQDEEEEVPVEA